MLSANLATPVSSKTQPELAALITPELDRIPDLTLRIIQNYQLPSALSEELSSVAHEALVRVANRYQEHHGVAFRTYALYRVHGAILDHLRQDSWLPRKPSKHLKSKTKKPKSGDGGNPNYPSMFHPRKKPNPPQLASAAQQADHALHQHLSQLATKHALRVLTASEQSEQLQEQPSVTKLTPVPEKLLACKRLQLALKHAIEQLDFMEQSLIMGHYFEDTPFDVVAQQLGISKTRACRKHQKALAKLTESLKNFHYSSDVMDDDLTASTTARSTANAARSPKRIRDMRSGTVPCPVDATNIVSPSTAAKAGNKVRANPACAIRATVIANAFVKGQSVITMTKVVFVPKRVGNMVDAGHCPAIQVPESGSRTHPKAFTAA
jgi:RNA polymerase sigma factor FliA